ncbi:MAG: cytochrome c biogenesis protein CcsA [Rhodanobacter sp.]|jgi:ABC-type uncharacterized transport system permease subunit|nr:cytochrome c biogenesis protein CcsA [Rhodanobacter sp.]
MTLLALAAIVLYLIAAGLLARPLLGGAAAERLSIGIAAVAVLDHASILLGTHRGELDLHFFAALSLVACVMAALTVLVNLWRRITALGVIVFPLAALVLGADVLAAAATSPQPLDWQIKLHATLALFAFSVLFIAAVLAILLAIQERALHHHQFGGLLRALPPLTLTEALLFRLIGAGFVLLTLTLLTGILFVDNLFSQHLIHKTVLSIAAWIVFGVLLAGRRRYGWRGRHAVNLTLIGMVILLLAFFGSKLVLELILQRTP